MTHTNGLDTVASYYDYKKQLRNCANNLDVLRFIAKMLIEIWWNTRLEDKCQHIV